MNPLLWRIGGPQGGGIDSAALLFSRLCARHGLHVLARREYHSNITGRHSYSDARVDTQPVHAHSSAPQILLCLDAETLCRHVKNVAPQGCIVYDQRNLQERLSQQKLLDSPILAQLSESLRQSNLPETIAGLLEYATQSGIANIPIDYVSLFKRLQEDLDLSKRSVERCRNVLTVAVSAALLKLDSDILLREVERVFVKKPAAVLLNTKAVMLAYEYINSQSATLEHVLVDNRSQQKEHIWVNGAQSVALGKLAAGIGIQTYYPISPATDESLYLETHNTVPW